MRSSRFLFKETAEKSQKETPTKDKSIENLKIQETQRTKNFPFNGVVGKYRITQEISRGGFGVVYLAYPNPFSLGNGPEVHTCSKKLKIFFEKTKSHILARCEWWCVNIYNTCNVHSI